MKRKLFTLLLAIIASICSLSAVKIGNLNYYLNDQNMTATVAEIDYSERTTVTVVHIPETVSYKKKTYRVTKIVSRAFYGCSNLTYVTIPNSVTSIGSWAFCDCKMNSITIPNNVTSIEEYTFSGCGQLTSITIPGSVKSIGKSAFSKCWNLTSITIPNSVTSIGESAFYNCSSLTSVTIGNSVKSIGNSAFYGCNRLTSVTIPKSVTSIGSNAFRVCNSLTSITIPNSVTSIGNGAFESCESLTSINVAADNAYYSSVGGVLFSKDQSTLIAYPYKGSTTYIIPNSVRSISNHAFYYCSDLASLTIPNSVKSIGNGAFAGCSKLTSLTIPNSVTSIGNDAFWFCKGLTSITIPDKVTSIGERSFYSCENLKELRYPQGLDLSKAKVPASTQLIEYECERPAYPPLLALVDGSLAFFDDSRNNCIDGGEKCNVRFKITNRGKGEAKDCEARVQLSGSKTGITAQSVQLPAIAPGKTCDVTIPIISTTNTQDGKVTLSIEVDEPNGFGVAPFNLAVATRAYEPPYLQVVDYNITSNSGKIRKMEPFTLTFNLQNTKYGVAEDVKLKINLPSNIYIVEGEKEMSYHQIRSGEVVKVQLSLLANNNYSTTNIPITIDVKEKHGKFAENKRLDIALNQVTSSTVNIAAKEEAEQERKEIQLAMMSSDVDRNIPVTNVKNPNTFVVIIANENYQQVSSVPFALNDGKIFRQYCEQTLGVSPKHIREYFNATGNQMKYSINLLREKVEEYDNPNIIFYYAGHGIPDEQSKTAYLLPVDGVLNDLSTCYKLDDLYAAMGDLPAGQISVFMDACFSGSKREQGMLASARGVALKAKSGVPQGNMVVFSAAQGDETAYPYSSQQHGMFTYYLLKKLQETKGDVTLQQLGDYIIKEVRRQSIEENDKKQTPSVTPSASIGTEWQNWKLK